MHPRRDASTTFRLVRGPFDKASRLSANFYSYDPGSNRSIYLTHLLRGKKSEHLIRLPTTFYRHGYSRDRRGSNTSVSPHFLPTIPGWKVKTCHYTHPTTHCFATDHPRGRVRQGPYPTISGIRPYPPSLDPASMHTTGQQERKVDVAQDSGSFHRLIPDVTTVSGDGQPFLGHIATAASTGIDKTSPHDTPASRSPLTL
jgi:hypothetical protein